ncbi:unnamed protein product, partial [Closterium sp. NIES-53]
SRGGQQQPLPHLDTLSPLQICEWVVQRARAGGGGFGFMYTGQRRQHLQRLPECVSQRGVPGCVEAAALGASESAVALGASESAAALGASASTATGPTSAEALHTFTLVSGASRCFFCDCTTVTLLTAPVPDQFVTVTTLGGEFVAICMDSRTGTHLATFTRRPGSGLYTPTTASAQVAASGPVAASSQVAASGPVTASGQLAASCSCRVLTHQTQLRHHRLGHPSQHRLHSMHSRLLVSGLPSPGPSPPYRARLPHRAFLAPLLTPPSFLQPPLLCRLSTWTFLRLHSDRGGEFSSGLLAEFCRDQGIRQTFTLPASPQQNVIAECRIGLVMEVARTSIIHTVALHFLWPFAVRYAAHQLNLWPRVSLSETSPTLRWTGEVGDESEFRVWGALSLVRNTTASKLSPCTLRCDFLGFPTDAPPWQFYHPRSRHTPSPHRVLLPQ